ncbi:MAG: hypothetical protein HYT13_01850 [Candidatus Liptonbacteria bacterium]|nr:hypothetical protein [Candidatus Liptonbacteria bacterium]
MKKGKKSFLVIFILVVVAVGLLGFNNIFRPAGSSNSSDEDPLSRCIQHLRGGMHIHPHLTIVIDGERQTISGNVGMSIMCMRPVHTHDVTGEIHIEHPSFQDFTLGDFFSVWQKPFSRGQILDYSPNLEYEIVMTVDGKPSDEFENLIFKDKQQIVIEYKKVVGK